MKLVECVPNFSEGRRPEVVASIARAIASVDGAVVLDVSSDASHNRTVVTFVGEPDAVGEAAFRATAAAWSTAPVWVRTTGEVTCAGKRTGAPLSRDARQLAIQETRSLGNRQYLVVASYEDKKFLLGVTPGRIEMLTPLAAPAALPEAAGGWLPLLA